METIGIKQLRDNWSYYINLVERGESVIINDRRAPFGMYQGMYLIHLSNIHCSL